jgi:hypothetical protein
MSASTIAGGIGTSLSYKRGRAGTDDALPAFFATGGVASELPSVPTRGRRPPANRGGALFCDLPQCPALTQPWPPVRVCISRLICGPAAEGLSGLPKAY